MPGNCQNYSSDCDYFHKILDQPALAETRNLAQLGQRLFQTPVAYFALFDDMERVTSRIGSGERWWPIIESFPLSSAFEDTLIAPDTAKWLPEGAGAGGLGFLVAAPVRGRDGLPLGLLILADHAPREGFSDADRQLLETLINAFTSNMELRVLATDALQSQMELIEAEKRFRAIANSAPVLIIYGGPDDEPLFVNHRWLEFTGRQLQEEMEESWTHCFHPEYRQSVLETYAQAFEQRIPFTTEVPMLRKDGEYRWMRGYGSPRFLENGTFMGYLGCIIDITDYRDALLEIERLKFRESATETAHSPPDY